MRFPITSSMSPIVTLITICILNNVKTSSGNQILDTGRLVDLWKDCSTLRDDFFCLGMDIADKTSPAAASGCFLDQSCSLIITMSSPSNKQLTPKAFIKSNNETHHKLLFTFSSNVVNYNNSLPSIVPMINVYTDGRHRSATLNCSFQDQNGMFKNCSSIVKKFAYETDEEFIVVNLTLDNPLSYLDASWTLDVISTPTIVTVIDEMWTVDENGTVTSQKTSKGGLASAKLLFKELTSTITTTTKERTTTTAEPTTTTTEITTTPQMTSLSGSTSSIPTVTKAKESKSGLIIFFVTMTVVLIAAAIAAAVYYWKFYKKSSKNIDQSQKPVGSTNSVVSPMAPDATSDTPQESPAKSWSMTAMSTAPVNSSSSQLERNRSDFSVFS